MAAGDGLISMKPTSIAHSGTSAVINADGGVDFSAIDSLSLNGVFTSSYENYLLVISGPSSVGTGVSFRYRVSGTDNSTASSYVAQYLGATGTTINANRQTGDAGYFLTNNNAQNAGWHMYFYAPALARPTLSRCVSAYGSNDARLEDWCNSHNQNVSYDGLTFYTSGATLTGNVHVFGYEE